MPVYIHVRGQNTLCERAVIEHFAELTTVFFMEMYYRVSPMSSSFSNFFIVFIKW